VSSAAQFEVKGWCPGALRPMQSGDGLIVRVRPQAGAFGLDTLVALAEAAARFGNGQIDLTRRANLQIRGISETYLTALHDVIGELGVLDETPEAEAVRNLVIGPLAGVDPTEVLDVREIARELARLLASDPAIWALPTKFGFILDGGGALTLVDERADIRLVAIRNGARPAIAIGLDTSNGIDWLGSVSPEDAAAAAMTTARAFLDATSRGPRQRMRDLSAEGLASLRSTMKPRFDPLTLDPQEPRAKSDASSARRIGLLNLGSGRYAVGIAAPFGRLEAEPFLKFAAAISDLGVKEIRLSPWRALYVESSHRQIAQAILDAAVDAGFMTDPTDSLLQIEACTGAPGCPSTSLDTRGDGRRLARLLAGVHLRGTVHVSGCAKGCAKSATSDLVLVGVEGRYGIVRNGTAQDRPARICSFSELAADPCTILDLAGGHKA
jgi:precorrin-3B synthase